MRILIIAFFSIVYGLIPVRAKAMPFAMLQKDRASYITSVSFTAASLKSDTVYTVKMKNCKKYKGKFIREDAENLYLLVRSFGEIALRKTDIKRIRKKLVVEKPKK